MKISIIQSLKIKASPIRVKHYSDKQRYIFKISLEQKQTNVIFLNEFKMMK